MLKILHTGDIHLDSAFSGLSPSKAEMRRQELRAAFTSMMTYAKMVNIDILLIAGDTFDTKTATKETISLLCREFRTFGKPIFITPGNHDPANSGSVWNKDIFPDNVYVFNGESLSFYDLDTLPVRVYGSAFTSEQMTTSPIEGLSVEKDGKYTVLLLHCDMLSANSTSCPVTEDQIESFGADYAALGHIHNPPEPGTDMRWSYCGCLEPRAFDETGIKGACVVEIDGIPGGETSITLRRVRFAKRRYEKGSLDVEGCCSNADVEEKIHAYISANGYGDDTLLSLELNGATEPGFVPDTDLLTCASNGLYLLNITDNTHPKINAADLERDPGLRGEIYRRLKSKLESDDEHEREIANLALKYALEALED